MANELAYSDETGLTVTADIYAAGGTVISAGVSLSETGSTGTYWADMPSASAQVVHVDYLVTGEKEASEDFYWDGSKRLTLVDAKTATGFATAAALNTAQNDLDIITGADGVNLLAATQASIDAIEADTNELQSDDVPTLIASLNNLSEAQIDARLAAYGLPTLAQILAAFTEIKGPGWTTTDTLEAIRDRGDAAWTTATGFSTFDHTADEVITDAASRTASQADVSGLATQASVDALPDAAAVRAEIDSNSTQLAALLIDTGTDIPALIAALNNLSQANVQAAIQAEEPITANITQVNGVAKTISDFQGGASAVTPEQIAQAIANQVSKIEVVNPLSNDGEYLHITIGQTLEFDVIAPIPANYTKIVWTVKARLDRPDNESIIRADDSTGLVTFNKVAASTAANAVVTVDQPNSKVTIKLLDNATLLLERTSKGYFDVRWEDGDGDSGRLTGGQCRIDYTATQAF